MRSELIQMSHKHRSHKYQKSDKKNNRLAFLNKPCPLPKCLIFIQDLFMFRERSPEGPKAKNSKISSKYI